MIWREGEGRRPRWREPHGQRLGWDSVGHMGKTYVHLGWGLRGVQRSLETEFGDDKKGQIRDTLERTVLGMLQKTFRSP